VCVCVCVNKKDGLTDKQSGTSLSISHQRHQLRVGMLNKLFYTY